MTVGLALLAAHTLADFPLQTDRMAAEKFDSHSVRFEHVAVHLAVTYLLLLFTPGVSITLAGIGALLVSALHFTIDTRRWVSGPPDWYPIAVDQSLHIASLWFVAVIMAVIHP